MKKILILSVLISGFTNAQEIIKTQAGKFVQLNSDNTWKYVDSPKTLTKEELKFNDRGLAYFTKNIELKNGKNQIVNVEFSVNILKEYINKINFDKIDSMIESTVSESKYSLKNTSTFIPISLKLNCLTDEGVVFWLDFSGQNNYGAEKDASKLVYFNENGSKIKSL